MRNRTIPLTFLLVVLVFAWLAHKPASHSPGPIDEPNESRIARDGSSRPERRERPDRDARSERSDRSNPADVGEDTGNSDGRSGSNGRAPRLRPTSAAPGTFDFYLLNLSWSPEFCATHTSAAECATHVGFILHGLWPQNTDGTYPEHCANTPPPADLDAFRDITPDPGLLHHEWQTHGTCSGLPGDEFFTLARKAFRSVNIPRELAGLTTETSRTPSDILADFARANPSFPPTSLALSCGNNRLTAVEVCMNKSAQPIACPELRFCRANTVRITPP